MSQRSTPITQTAPSDSHHDDAAGREIFILVCGTPMSGFECRGPFEGDDDADEAGSGNDDRWPVALENPHQRDSGYSPTGKHVVVNGSFASGFTFSGPFGSGPTAVSFAEQCDGDWYVVELAAP